jgi:hypothetical protein
VAERKVEKILRLTFKLAKIPAFLREGGGKELAHLTLKRNNAWAIACVGASQKTHNATTQKKRKKKMWGRFASSANRDPPPPTPFEPRPPAVGSTKN